MAWLSHQPGRQTKVGYRDFVTATFEFEIQLTRTADAPGARSWEEASALAKTFISQLNLTEKANLVTGSIAGQCPGNISPISRMNFTGLCLMDGPLTVHISDLASVFPAGVTTAATWNKDLMYQRGLALGTEFRGKGAHIMLGYVSFLG